MKDPSASEQEPWLAELAEVQAERRAELMGVDVSEECFAALTPDEQNRLEDGVLRRLGLEASPGRANAAPKASWGARASAYGWLGGLALAACFVVLVMRLGGNERAADLPAFELLPPPGDATVRSADS